jgi:hypothetical protein
LIINISKKNLIVLKIFNIKQIKTILMKIKLNTLKEAKTVNRNKNKKAAISTTQISILGQLRNNNNSQGFRSRVF